MSKNKAWCRGTAANQILPATLPRLVGALARLYQKSFEAIQKAGSDELDSADMIGKQIQLKTKCVPVE